MTEIEVIEIEDDEEEDVGAARGLPRQRLASAQAAPPAAGAASDGTGVISARSGGDDAADVADSGAVGPAERFASSPLAGDVAEEEAPAGGDDDGAFMAGGDVAEEEELDDDEGGAFLGQRGQYGSVTAAASAQPDSAADGGSDSDDGGVEDDEQVQRSESLVFPLHVRAQLAARQSAFRPAPQPGDLRLGFETLRRRPSGTAMHACKLGCAAMLLPGYTEHSDAGVRAAAEAFRVRDVRSRVAVARVPPGNPAYPGFGAFAAVPLPAFKAVCQYAGVVLLDGEANAKQAAALATAAQGGGEQGAAAVLTCFVDTPAGGTVIDGAPANRPRGTCSFVNDGRTGPGKPGRPNNVALLPATCPGCAACPGLVHQHMMLVTLVPVAKGTELLLDYGKAYWKLHDELVARAAALSPPRTPPPPLGLVTLALGVADDVAGGAAGAAGAVVGRQQSGAEMALDVARAASGSSGDGRGAKRPRGTGGAHPAAWGLPWYRRPDLDFSRCYVKPQADAARLEAAGLLWPAEGLRPLRKLRYLDGRALLAARNGLDVPPRAAQLPRALPPLRPAAAAAVVQAEESAALAAARAAHRAAGFAAAPHDQNEESPGRKSLSSDDDAAAAQPAAEAAAAPAQPPPQPAPPADAAPAAPPRLRSPEALAEALADEPGCSPASVAALWDAIQACISACNPPRADGACYRFHIVDFGSTGDAAWDAFGAMFSPPQRAAEVARACTNAARAANGAPGQAAARVRAAAAAVMAAPQDISAALRLAAVSFGMAWAGDDPAAPPHLCVVGLDAAGNVVSDPPLGGFRCDRVRGPCGFVLRFGRQRFCALLWRLAGAGGPPPPAAPAVVVDEAPPPQPPGLDAAGVRAAAAREHTRARLASAVVSRDAAYAAAQATMLEVAAAQEVLRKAQQRAEFAQRLFRNADAQRKSALAADEAATLALTLHSRKSDA